MEENEQSKNEKITFLKELVERARKYGYLGDYVEVRDFVRECFIDVGKSPPTDEELEPYE